MSFGQLFYVLRANVLGALPQPRSFFFCFFFSVAALQVMRPSQQIALDWQYDYHKYMRREPENKLVKSSARQAHA